MTNTEYHNKTEYLSKSNLDLIRKSPAHYKAFLDGEKSKPTPAMVFGSLVHSVVFNEDNFAVMPECDRRTKEGKAIYEQFLSESAGKELIVTSAQYETALKIKAMGYILRKTREQAGNMCFRLKTTMVTADIKIKLNLNFLEKSSKEIMF